MSLLFKVAAALLNGDTLRTPTHTVGPDRLPFAADGAARFLCVDRTGMPVFAWETWDAVESAGDWDRRGNGAQFVPQKRRDWSAFGAARSFLEAHADREHEVHIALRRAEQAKRGAFQAGPRDVEVYRVRPRAAQ